MVTRKLEIATAKALKVRVWSTEGRQSRFVERGRSYERGHDSLWNTKAASSVDLASTLDVARNTLQLSEARVYCDAGGFVRAAALVPIRCCHSDSASDRRDVHGHMSELITPNQRSHHNEGLSVSDVDVSLDEGSLRSLLLGQEVFFETEYAALRRGGDVALVAVRKEPVDALFSRVTDLTLLAGPDQTAWVVSPDTDTTNVTALALAARAHGRHGMHAYVVEGRYNQVNFIWQPSLLPVTVRDLVPPDPPKLLTMAQQVVAFDQDLPPIDLVLDAVDVRRLATEHPAQRYLLQCRGSGVQLPVPTEFLDTHPPERHDWLLIGCQLSRHIHQRFYGDEPQCVETCPLRRPDAPATESALAKCCLIGPGGVDYSSDFAAVTWGASLNDIRRALRLLTGVDKPSTSTPASWVEPLADRPNYRAHPLGGATHT